jgi:dTDP-4-amino-4,6-dideoxygalactose transaminase
MMAAILLAKFEIFDEEIGLRQKVAKRYSSLLKDFVKTPVIKEFNVSAWAQYSIVHPYRQKILDGLNKEGIPTAVYYPKPLHLQDAFEHLGYKKGDFPVSEETAETIFSIPMHPYLSHGDQDKIVDAIKKYAK